MIRRTHSLSDDRANRLWCSANTENKATSTYQRGDLLKMHTYNDAVRQTAGSYVLYPGSDKETRMDKFHEIVPGVGAFVLKPGNEACRTALKDFLMEVFRHQASQFTQYRHFSDVLHAIVREEPLVNQGLKTFRPDATCVLVYVKPEVRELSRTKRLVYCRVLKDDETRTPIRIKLGSLSGAVLCPYEGSRSGPKISLPWQATIVSSEMMSREQLCRILTNEGWPAAAMPATASAYLLFRLDEPSSVPARMVSPLTPGGSYEAVSKSMWELDAGPAVSSVE